MALPTGGTITEAVIAGTNYRIHTFAADGSFVCDAALDVEYLLVAGGASGARTSGSAGVGGAAAGGIRHNLGGTKRTLIAGTYPVVIGVGGAGQGASAAGNSGTATFFDGLAADGGGGGGGVDGLPGGSGGGGGGPNGPDTAGGVATAGQGNDGGFGRGSGSGGGGTPRRGGGGGGAGAPGGNAVLGGLNGKGGDGIELNPDGNPRYFGGGGGGASPGTGDKGIAGLGGGTAGKAAGSSLPGTNGLGGGSGGTQGAFPSGKGGDGIAIIRYAFDPPATAVASGILTLTGVSSAAALASGAAAGTVSIGGSAVATAPALVPLASRRLAFATETPRQGRILTDGTRKGLILNPRRAPKPVELTA